jgi:putative Mn2+ efflux pump MntP
MNSKNIIILIANIVLISAAFIFIYLSAFYMENGFDVRTIAFILLILVGLRNIYQVMKKSKPKNNE